MPRRLPTVHALVQGSGLSKACSPGKVRVFVPATVGNVGPGFDVLGLAIDGLGDEISAEPIDGPTIIASITGRDAEILPHDPALNSASIAANSMLRRLGDPVPGLAISIHRGLPACGGLGASAASAVGGALAAALALRASAGTPETKAYDADIARGVLEAALDGEEAVAGRHLDNIAPALFGGLALVVDADTFDVVSLPVAAPWWVVVVTPDLKIRTREARSALPPSLEQSAWVHQMARTSALVAAFATGDEALLARGLIDLYAEPRRSHLIEGFDRVKAAALAHGALGASISGAGPTVFAITPSRAEARACEEAMVDAFKPVSARGHSGPIATMGATLVEPSTSLASS